MNFGESIGGWGRSVFALKSLCFAARKWRPKILFILGLVLEFAFCYGVVLGGFWGMAPSCVGEVFWIAVSWRFVRCFSGLRERWPPFSGSALLFLLLLLLLLLLLFLSSSFPLGVLFPFFLAVCLQDLVDATGPAQHYAYFALFLSPLSARVGRPPPSFFAPSSFFPFSFFFPLSLSLSLFFFLSPLSRKHA